LFAVCAVPPYVAAVLAVCLKPCCEECVFGPLACERRGEDAFARYVLLHVDAVVVDYVVCCVTYSPCLSEVVEVSVYDALPEGVGPC
jgi:hypothetical protein